MKESEKIALIKLIADPSPEVFSIVQDKILELGFPILHQAHEFYAKEQNIIVGNRLIDMNKKLVGTKLQSVFLHIKKTEQINYTDFLLALSYLHNPFDETDKLMEFLTNIENQLHNAVNKSLTFLNKIKLISYILYEINDLKPITNNFHSEHFFLTTLVGKKSAITEVFGILFIVLAEKIGLTLVPVYLPLAHILGVMDNQKRILFYINPGYKGAIITEKEISNYLKRNHFKASERHAKLISTLEFIRKFLQMLELQYRNENNLKQADFILQISRWLN
jgi:regulator of sirC expression with transglutaminase-like and TPR domain